MFEQETNGTNISIQQDTLLCVILGGGRNSAILSSHCSQASVRARVENKVDLKSSL